MKTKLKLSVIVIFYGSTWLDHWVSRYLIKHYSVCLRGSPWRRLTIKSVDWVKQIFLPLWVVSFNSLKASIWQNFPRGSDIKESACNAETGVPSLGWADPLEKEMATHSWILAWRIPRTEKPGGLRSMGSQSQTQRSNIHFHCQWDRIPPRWLFDLGHQLFYTFGLFLGLKPTVFRLRFVSLALVGFQLASCGYWNFSILMIYRLIPYNRSLYTHTHTHTHTHTFYFSEEPRIIHWVKCQGLGRVQHIGCSSGLVQSCWGLEQWVGKSSCEASDVRTDQVEWGIAFLKRYLTSSMSFYFTWKENKEKKLILKKGQAKCEKQKTMGKYHSFY